MTAFDEDDAAAAADDEPGASGDADAHASALAEIDALETAALASLADDAGGQAEDGRQKRQNVRVEVRLPIKLISEGRIHASRTRDLSATGAGFTTRLPLGNGDRVEVEVELDDFRLRKQSVVRFARPLLAGVHVGVEFEGLSAEEREQMVRLVFDMQRQQLRGG